MHGAYSQQRFFQAESMRYSIVYALLQEFLPRANMNSIEKSDYALYPERNIRFFIFTLINLEQS